MRAVMLHTRRRLAQGVTLPRVLGIEATARYGGEASDLPAPVLQGFLDAVAAGRLTLSIHRTYTLDQIAQAHADMESGAAVGKLVVVL